MKDINLLQTLFLGNQDNDAMGVQPFGFGGPNNRGGFGNDGNQFGNFDGRGRGGRGRGGWRGRGGDGMFRGGQDNGFRGRGGHNHGGPQGGHQFGTLVTSRKGKGQQFIRHYLQEIGATVRPMVIHVDWTILMSKYQIKGNF